MRIFTFVIALLCGGALSLPAQSDDQEPKAAVEATLTAKRPVVSPGHTIELVLRLRFHEDATVPATLLAGRDLKTFVDGEPADPIRDAVEGEVKVGAGTLVERLLEIPTPETWPDRDLSEHSRVRFEWPGFEKAVVSVRLVPDQRNLDLAKLDLDETKVRLVTSKGDIVLRFDADPLPDGAPKHVANFIKLARDGFYDGTTFHRVSRNFMIQGGCPNTKPGATGTPGTGHPGYRIDAEFNKNKHVRGALSMARGDDVNSAGCQFFIVHRDSTHLDALGYTVFGMVEAGMETVDAIADSPVVPNSRGEPSEPVEPVRIHAAVVEPAFVD